MYAQVVDKNQNLKEIFHLKCPVDGCSREDLRKVFLGSCHLHQTLFSIIIDEKGFYVRPEPLRHPLIFYYGHTASVYVNKLFDHGLITQRVDPKMQTTMAVGVDQMKWDDLDQNSQQWPTLEQVKIFRKKVIELILSVLDTIDVEISWTSDCWAFLMGLEHERLHLETSAAIIRRLDPKYISQSSILRDCPLFITNQEKVPKNQLETVPKINFKWENQIDNAISYGWDNEFGVKSFNVKEFKASKMLVSNSEFLEFVNDGGYQKMEYWDLEGKNWLSKFGPRMPVYWLMQNGRYMLRTVNKIMPLPLDWPAEVNNLEASAFCQWKSIKTKKNLRLPTEEQLYALKQNFMNEDNEKKCNKNLNFWFSPCPVHMFNFGSNFYDISGNVWQLTKSKIYLFDGAEPHPLYEDYTLPCEQDQKHYLLIGNSFASFGAFANYTVRNCFRRHFYQASGFRYVEASPEQKNYYIENTKQTQAHMIKTLKQEENSLKLHFKDNQTYLQQALQILKNNVMMVPQKQGNKCLVIGCSVGRLVLELSKYYKKSIGTDYCARYFSLGQSIIDEGQLNHSGQVIQCKDFCASPQNVSFIQMNSENPNPKKIYGSELIILDGTNIKPGKLQNVIRNTKCLLKSSEQYHYMVINELGKNFVEKQKFLQFFPGCEEVSHKVTPISSSISCEEKILINLYKVQAE